MQQEQDGTLAQWQADGRGLTERQRAVVAKLDGEPWAWAVVTSEGFVAVRIDRASAERYAADTHGIVRPLRP
jgi:hypothetical protein